MGKLKRISGTDVVKVLGEFGFAVVSQKGSHIKLRREIEGEGHKQTLVVPEHKELDTGTLRAIVRQAARYVPEQELRTHFYTE